MLEALVPKTSVSSNSTTLPLGAGVPGDRSSSLGWFGAGRGIRTLMVALRLLRPLRLPLPPHPQ